MRRFAILLVLGPALALAQPPASPTPEATPSPAPQADGHEVTPPPPAAPARAPKLLVVLVGDPDDEARGLAQRVEASLLADPTIRVPVDAGLRAAARGEEGTPDDGLGEVRAQRRRLGLGETVDAPVLAALGRRAGADAVVVVYAGPEPHVLVLDVRNGAFFDGQAPLEESSNEAVARFVLRRARASIEGASMQEGAATPAPPAATHPDRPRHEPDFFEQYWPYGLALLGLAALITIVIIGAATASNGQSAPVLHFVPGPP